MKKPPSNNTVDLGALARWRVLTKPPASYSRYDTVLQVVRKDNTTAPHAALLAAVSRRQQKTDNTPLATLPEGTTVCRFCYDPAADTFTTQEALRQAIKSLLALSPKTVLLDVRVPAAAATVLYVALIAAARLPGVDHRPPPSIALATTKRDAETDAVAVIAQANTLARALIKLPPNILTPSAFVRQAKQLAKQHQLETTVYTAAKLKQLGAGAMLAVGRASASEPPAILYIRYRPRAARRVTLVGKGICFDTGGVNVKPARYMRGMGKDMAGAATALAAVIGAAQLKLSVGVDVWLAIAENAVGADAYRPDEVITALNGKQIEIVHTDAEGRMVLADTLTMASEKKTDIVISYATLTGTMHVALGERMSGFFSNDDKWQVRALTAAAASGERLCYFPMPVDYKDGLKSDIADIKQCAEKGEADHILAALFLQEFIRDKQAWCHVDLSSVSCEGGLAAAPGPITGFGVAWTLALLRRYSA